MFRKLLLFSLVVVSTITFIGCASNYDAIKESPYDLGDKPVLDTSMYPKGTKFGVYKDGSKYIEYKNIRYIGKFEVRKSCKDFDIDKEDLKYTLSIGKGTIVSNIKNKYTMVEFIETKTCHLGDIYIVDLSKK